MKKGIVLLIAITLTFLSCGKGGEAIPNVAVNFQASVTDPRLSALNVLWRFCVYQRLWCCRVDTFIAKPMTPTPVTTGAAPTIPKTIAR